MIGSVNKLVSLNKKDTKKRKLVDLLSWNPLEVTLIKIEQILQK